MDFMKENGVANQSFIKGTFIGDDLNFCNEIRSAIEITISETNKLKSKIKFYYSDFFKLRNFRFLFLFLNFGILDFLDSFNLFSHRIF